MDSQCFVLSGLIAMAQFIRFDFDIRLLGRFARAHLLFQLLIISASIFSIVQIKQIHGFHNIFRAFSKGCKNKKLLNKQTDTQTSKVYKDMSEELY